MAKTNLFLQKGPFAVSDGLSLLSANLKTARKRRNLSVRQVADKLGVGVRSVMDAENGKPTTAVSTYLGLLWIYGLLDNLRDVADPLKDTEGLRLAAARENRTPKSDLDNDF